MLLIVNFYSNAFRAETQFEIFLKWNSDFEQFKGKKSDPKASASSTFETDFPTMNDIQYYSTKNKLIFVLM